MSGTNDHNARRAWRRTISVPAQPLSAPHVRAFARETAAAAGFSPTAVDEIELAVGEAVTNAILYGHPDRNAPSWEQAEPPIIIEAGVVRDGRAFFIEVCDPGPGFDLPGARRSGREDSDNPGGRGLDLMEALMDRVHFHFDGSGTRVRMERSLSRSL